MPWPLFALAGAQVAGSVAGYIAGRKNRTPKFETTATGRELTRVSKEGRYSPATVGRILGETSKRAGNVAQTRRAATRGYLASIGAERSIAGASALSQPLRDVQRQVGNVGTRLAVENAMSKQDAAMQLALGTDESRARRRSENLQAIGGLIGGLTQAGGTAYQNYLTNRKLGLEKQALGLRKDEIAARSEYWKRAGLDDDTAALLEILNLLKKGKGGNATVR